MTLYVLYDLSPFSLPFDFSPSLKYLAKKYRIPYSTLRKNLYFHRKNRAIGFTIEKIFIQNEETA